MIYFRPDLLQIIFVYYTQESQFMSCILDIPKHMHTRLTRQPVTQILQSRLSNIGQIFGLRSSKSI